MDEYQTLDINASKQNISNHWPEQILQYFDIKHALGEGGQGSVFLAFEYRLQREVAIKRIIQKPFNDTLLMEAQAQANIEHPNISKLFAVVQTPEQSNFLIMQYIQGQTALNWAKAQHQSCRHQFSKHHFTKYQFTKQANHWQQYINQVVKLSLQICDGLHALHSKGIVHRDIKPANIMITEDKTGNLHPYIVDFGLAQHQQSANDSISGSQHFMSPEQQRGDPLSNTSDLYSLGVTLYQLLTRQLPHSDVPSSLVPASHLTALVDSQSNIKLPIELSAIINKCLAPDRQHRYQSALELKQELQRFLAGDPINTISSKSYQIKKQLYKHRKATLAAMFIGLTIIGQLLWQQHQQVKTKQRETLIQRFHQTVQQAQYQSNLAYMSPAHDISYLQSKHRQNLNQIISHAQTLGPSALPFALYAKGHIAEQQGQHQKAKQLLQQAWQQGFQTIESAYAQVQVLNTLYQQGLIQIYVMPHGPLRQAQQQQLQQQFVTPIIGYLEFIERQQSGNVNQGQQNYIRALLKYYNQDYHGSIALLTDINQFSPWHYQHHLLLGHSYLAQYQQLRKPQSTQAKQLLNQATHAFDQAITIAPSDPNNYLQKWQLYFTLIGNNQFGTGDALISLDNATKTINKALTVGPNNLDIRISQIQTQFQYMVYIFNQGKQWQEALHKCKTLVEQAISQWPQQPKLLRLQAKILSRELAHNQSPNLLQSQYQAVGQVYQQLASQLQLKFDDLIYYALHLKHWGDYLEDKRQIREKYQQAAKLFEQAIDSRPQYSGSYVNLALIELKLSETYDKQQALTRLENATQLLQAALNNGYSEFIANYYLAKVRLAVSEHIRTDNLLKAIDQLDYALNAIAQAHTAKPNNYHAIDLEIEILIELINNHWFLNESQPELTRRLLAMQLQKLDDNPTRLSVLSDSAFVLTMAIERQQATTPANTNRLLQLQDISERLNQALNKSSIAKPANTILNDEQTLALSNLIYAKIIQSDVEPTTITKQSSDELTLLIERFEQTTKDAEYFWLLGNYYQLLANQHKSLAQQIEHQNQAIELWQKSHQANVNHMGYQFSLIKGYIQKLIFIAQLNTDNQLISAKVANQLSEINQLVTNNKQLHQWINTLLQQHQSGQLMTFLNNNKTQIPFAVNIKF